MPHTFEAWIYIPEELPAYVGGDSRLGTIISNYSGFPVMPYFHWDMVKSEGGYSPRLEWRELYDTNNGNTGFHATGTSNAEKHEIRTQTFSDVVIPVGEWTHIAITVDARNASALCYKNGVLAQTITNIEFLLGDLDVRLVDLPIVIGNDNRNGQPYYFRGELASLSLYAGTRTAAEIKADYEQGVNTDDEDLLGHWEFAMNGDALPALVEDLSGNGLSLSHNRMWINATEADFATLPDNYAYTMIAVGDTQYMVQNDANYSRSNADLVYGWIADHADELNLKVVMGLGDITNTDTDDQWTVAYNALTKLNGIVPYTLVRGNHDILKGGAKFDALFGADATYAGQFGGTTGGVMTKGSVTNTYYTFNAEGTDWMVVNLDWAPTDEMLDWASLIIATHPNHKVIVNTHCYAHLDYTTCDKEDTSSNMTAAQNYGDQIWDKLIYHHENIVMVLSGHQESNLVTMFQAQGKH
ncbi:MAG: metallophosphoesterase, partial [Clostridia bacterium]|nr:metallophosphoesterase [Clostridia bacterium]